ncbi:MAG: seriplasmic sensor signal transduction histidine kinase [uncultured bacterium]|nr:MAG: seriplasmic sensor signal transduction histidine kinase [uncultured bacterium]
MSKTSKQNLESIIKTINKNIVLSFSIILVFFVIVISAFFISYKSREEKLISDKLNAAFSAFISKTSQKLVSIAMEGTFVEYLNSGWLSRKQHYDLFLSDIHHTGLSKMVIGMDILDSNGMNIFSYGRKTGDYVVLDLCYLNRRIPNFDVGNCNHSWILYFKLDAVAKELRGVNPELIYCANCTQAVVRGGSFGDFPMPRFSGMKVNLGITKGTLATLWKMVIFIVSLLLLLIIWNVNRIKSIFKKYFSDPVAEIASKIKGNEALPQAEIEELAYLVDQIEVWKKQTVELEVARGKEKAKENEAKAMQSVGASVAHELRTPLRSIISGVTGIERFLPTLLDAYDLAKKSDLPVKNIKPRHIELLHKLISNLKTEGAAANTIVDMLLMKIKGSITGATYVKKLYIGECLSEALQRYYFQKSERDLVVCDMANSFQFIGDNILVIHILFNLLKNALYCIASVQKGCIHIHFERGENENRLHFMDTGKGIAKEVLPHIFDRFFSKTDGGVGIGLSFCKMAMEWMGGEEVFLVNQSKMNMQNLFCISRYLRSDFYV